MPTLAYWGIRGLAQPLRFLLAYLGVEYEDKQYSSPDAWFGQDKPALKTSFPNLPYFIDGETVITESSAIAVHIIKKHNRAELLGQNADGSYSEKEVRVEQLLGVFRDIQKTLVPMLLNADFINIKEKIYTDTIGPLFAKILNSLADKDFLVGTLTYADFILYELATVLKHVYPQSVTPQIASFFIRFEEIKQIKEYLVKPTVNLKIFYPPGKFAWSGPQ